MKKKKILSLILVGVVAATSLIGCGKTKTSDTSGLDEMDKSPITFTFFTSDLSTDIPFTDDVAKEIEKLTGVTLKIEHPVAGDTQAIPLMIASGEYPDLIYAKGDTSKLVDAGAIVSLDDYIEKSGDNLKDLYGDQINRLKYSLEDPTIYTVGTYGVTAEVFEPSGTMQIQHKVLEEMGYPKINTIYDYEKVVKEYLEKNPTISDGQKRIGLSLMASDWRWLLTVGNVASATAGIADDGQFAIDDSTGEAKYKFMLPEVKEYLKWLNNMNDIGLLDPESFTQKEDTYKAKISSGRVIGLTDSHWDYQSAELTLISDGKPEETYARLPVVTNEKYKAQELKDYGYGGGWGIAISSSAKDPDRAFEFLDWLASDEAQVLLNWGIKDKHYAINEEGKREFLPEIQEQKNTDPDFSKKTGIGLYTYPFPQRGIGALDANGDSYTPTTLKNVVANYNEAEKKTLKAYGVEALPELYPQPKDLERSKHGQAWQFNIPTDSDMAIIQKKADDYCQQAITQAILGKPADFDAAWDEIQETLIGYGIEEVNEAMTKMTKEKIDLWN